MIALEGNKINILKAAKNVFDRVISMSIKVTQGQKYRKSVKKGKFWIWLKVVNLNVRMKCLTSAFTQFGHGGTNVFIWVIINEFYMAWWQIFTKISTSRRWGRLYPPVQTVSTSLMSELVQKNFQVLLNFEIGKIPTTSSETRGIMENYRFLGLPRSL